MYLYPYSEKLGGERAGEAAKVQKCWSDNNSVTTQTVHEVRIAEMRVGRGELLFRLTGAEFLANAVRSGLKGLLRRWSRKTPFMRLAKSAWITHFQMLQHKSHSVIVLDLLNSFSVVMCKCPASIALTSSVPFYSGSQWSGDDW